LGESRGVRAVRGQSGDDLSGVGDIASRDGGGGGENGGDGELHFDRLSGWDLCTLGVMLVGGGLRRVPGEMFLRLCRFAVTSEID